MTDDPFEERIELMREARREFEDMKKYGVEAWVECIDAADEFFDLYDKLVAVLDPDDSWNTAP